MEYINDLNGYDILNGTNIQTNNFTCNKDKFNIINTDDEIFTSVINKTTYGFYDFSGCIHHLYINQYNNTTYIKCYVTMTPKMRTILHFILKNYYNLLINAHKLHRKNNIIIYFYENINNKLFISTGYEQDDLEFYKILLKDMLYLQEFDKNKFLDVIEEISLKFNSK